MANSFACKTERGGGGNCSFECLTELLKSLILFQILIKKIFLKLSLSFKKLLFEIKCYVKREIYGNTKGICIKSEYRTGRT